MFRPAASLFENSNAAPRQGTRPTGKPQNAPRAGPRGREQILQAVFGGDLEYFKAQSPWRIAEQHAAALHGKTRIRQVIGNKDETLRFNREFHEHLVRLEIPHEYRELPGLGHRPMSVLHALGGDNWPSYRTGFSAETPPRPHTTNPGSRIRARLRQFSQRN